MAIKVGCIYALVEPGTIDWEDQMEIRYVGYTCAGIQRRLQWHIDEARSGGRTHKCNWIRKLLRCGKRPEIIELDWGIREDLPQMEREWIADLKQVYNLTNGTEGGDGVLGQIRNPHTPESKKLMSDKAIERLRDPAERKKISDGLRGKKKSRNHRRKLSEASARYYKIAPRFDCPMCNFRGTKGLLGLHRKRMGH